MRTGPGQDLTADIEIRLAGFTLFAPTVFKPATPPRRDSAGAMRPGKPDRIAPLFPRYLFVQFRRDTDAWQAIRRLPGVEAILGPANRPTPVPDQVITLIRAQCAPNGCVYPPSAPAGRPQPLPIGAAARLLAGPMAGLSGVCTASDGVRVRLLLEIMGHAVPVTVPQTTVEAV